MNNLAVAAAIVLALRLFVLPATFLFISTTYYCVPLVLVVYYWLPKQSTVNGKRRLSTVSEICAKNTFPPQYGVAPPKIVGLMLFDELPAVADVKKLMTEKVLSDPGYVRFRSLVEDEQGMKVWRELPAEQVNLDKHVLVEEVKDEDDLHSRVEALMLRELPPSQPLWEMVLLRNVNGRSGMCLGVHHSLGDGLSLLGCFLNIVTTESGAPVPHMTLERKAKAPAAATATATPTEAKPAAAAAATQTAMVVLSLLGKVLRSVVHVLSLPISTDAPHALRWTGPISSYKFAGRRTIAKTSNLSLDRVKAIKNRFQASVNDVVTACAVGAIRRYLEYRKDPTVSQSSLQFRALMPYAFPMSDRERQVILRNKGDLLRNAWTFISARLPMSLPASASVERLRAVKEEMDHLKSSADAPVQRILAELVNRLPFTVASQTAFELMLKHSMVFSNVPGPTETVYLAGKPVVDLHPCFPNVGSQAIVVSYAGKLRLNFVVDTEAVPEAQKLCTFFEDELNALYEAVSQGGDDSKSNKKDD